MLCSSKICYMCFRLITFLFRYTSLLIFSKCRKEKFHSTITLNLSRLRSCYVQNISTLHPTKSKLKKQTSCPSLVYRLRCDNCGYDHRTTLKCCILCDTPVPSSSSTTMLFEKNSVAVKCDRLDFEKPNKYQDSPDLNLCNTNTRLHESRRSASCLQISNTCSSTGEQVESSHNNLLSDINMWLCHMCKHSNSVSVINCIICKNSKTDTRGNDSNNNPDDSNNNKSNDEESCNNNFQSRTDISVFPQITAENKCLNTSEELKKWYRRSGSYETPRSIRPSQRLSFSNLSERILSPGSPKYSYIGISEPVPPIPCPVSSQNNSKWTCDKCSFSENEASSSQCNVCDALVSECSMIIVNKDSVRYTPPKRHVSSDSLSSHDSLRQSLDVDFQHLLVSYNFDKDEWICKKCTLVNADDTAVCIACGGSKIRSLTSTPEATLKYGEFWLCPRCTLKNSLKEIACVACKTPHSEVSTSVRYNMNTGQYTVNTMPKYKKDHIISSRKKPLPKATHQSRSFQFSNKITELINGTAEKKTWICDECTFENSVESPSCEMCQSSRTICSDVYFSTDTFSKRLSDHDNTSIVLQTKQQSELMEHLRQNEEQEALIKWQQIVQYCKEVSRFFVVRFL